MLAASLDNAIDDHMDTIRWPDRLPTRTCSSLGIVRLSGPIRDRADRVTQVCHLERIVPEARSPNWPYGRLDRAPLSVPLVTTLGAPRGGAKTTCERWQDRSVASGDGDPAADKPSMVDDVVKLEYNTLTDRFESPAARTDLLRAMALRPDPGLGSQPRCQPFAPACRKAPGPIPRPSSGNRERLAGGAGGGNERPGSPAKSPAGMAASPHRNTFD